MQIFEAFVAQLGVGPGAAVRELFFGRGHGGLVGIEEAPETVIWICLEFLACGRVTDRLRELVFGDRRRDAWAGTADGGDTAGFVFFATDRACLRR
jgi:hypothetical protein